MIKADTTPKEMRVAATLKTNNGQRSDKGKQRSKSHPIVWHVSFACSPQRRSVRVNTSNTQYLHKTQRTQLLAIHIISSGNRDMDPSQRSLPAEVSMIKQRFVVWLFSPVQIYFQVQIDDSTQYCEIELNHILYVSFVICGWYKFYNLKIIKSNVNMRQYCQKKRPPNAILA